jgi:hypothetical protein
LIRPPESVVDQLQVPLRVCQIVTGVALGSFAIILS